MQYSRDQPCMQHGTCGKSTVQRFIGAWDVTPPASQIRHIINEKESTRGLLLNFSSKSITICLPKSHNLWDSSWTDWTVISFECTRQEGLLNSESRISRVIATTKTNGYEYNPLQRSRNKIRLLRLLPIAGKIYILNQIFENNNNFFILFSTFEFIKSIIKKLRNFN